MESLAAFLGENAVGDLVPWSVQVRAMDRFSLGCAEVEDAILSAGLLPARYQRNRQMLSTAQQLRLFRSRVAVAGCGGLGGFILEELARLGVGHIIAIDPDTFEEHNLNRQVLSSPSTLGVPKVQAAADRLAEINPAVTVAKAQIPLGAQNAATLLGGADVAADALDNIQARLELAAACGSLGIPLVHGAIAGWYGQVTTILPGDQCMATLYGNWKGGRGIESQMGNPSFTPALVASLQVAEICKILVGCGNLLRGKSLAIDLLAMEIHEIPL